MFCDTHCHIFKEDFENIDEIIAKAQSNNVGKYINNATDSKSITEVIELCDKYENMYAAVGFHPEFADKITENDFDYLRKCLTNKKVIAMGEIGLDYHYTKDNKTQQIELFEKQLAIAQEYNLPVIVHNREATLDIINCLKKYNVKGVIHCFNGSLETANIFIKMGFKLGINGVITFKNCKLKEVIKQLPLSDFVLETDCPYLAPEPLRGTKNDPSNIIFIAKFVAEIYKISLLQVENITNANIRQIFDI